jgi:MoxR-like ATPase
LNDRKEVDLMDCFLIKYCIWNEEEQIETVYGFVKDAIEKHGYTYSLDFGGIRKELDEFKKEIDEETKFIKDTRVKSLTIVYNDYYEVLNPPSRYDNLINKSDFDRLSNQDQSIHIYYWEASWGQVRNHTSYNIRKGNSKFSLFINNTKYDLKTITQGEKRQATKKPNEYTEKAWDGRVNDFLQHIDDIKNQIEQYRNKDLEHLRTNLFVDPTLANIVETHITATQKGIEKIDLEIREIQNGYKKLKDEEVILNA